jgi:hypothetical protein
LKDDADLRGQTAALGGIARIETANIEQRRARLQNAREAQKQAGFAGAIGSDQANALAGDDREGNPSESGCSVGIGEEQIAHLNG